jgi:hypothetical protein
MTILPISRYASLAMLLALAVVGCAVTPLRPLSDPGVMSAWVELGPQGRAQARAIVVEGHACPNLQVDGATVPMTLRVAASQPPVRPTATAMAGVKPAIFDMDVCEALLPSGSREAHVGAHDLPVPAKTFRRIVVLGDTGCRIKGPDLQNCDNPATWPFATVAASAARLKPDLVLHVGDYHYRETPCPVQAVGCSTSPWGYGWDVWRADFFEPAAPLLAGAPWVFVRGNHEECARAGQGWFRLLAPESWNPDRSCDLVANDTDANFTPPYAVPLIENLQLLVFDSAHAGNDPLNAANADDALTLDRYHDQLGAVGRMAARPGLHSWFVGHHPVLGYTPDFRHPGATPLPGNPALQGALRDLYGAAYFPTGVDFAIHGHVHLFQAISYSSHHPATLVAGNGGDNLDHDLPRDLPPGLTPAVGAAVGNITHAETFGFLLLENTSPSSLRWQIHAYRIDGSVLTECVLVGSAMTCTPDGAIR